MSDPKPLTPTSVAIASRSNDLINQINAKCQTLVTALVAIAEDDRELSWGNVGTLQNMSDQLDELLMHVEIM